VTGCAAAPACQLSPSMSTCEFAANEGESPPDGLQGARESEREQASERAREIECQRGAGAGPWDISRNHPDRPSILNYMATSFRRRRTLLRPCSRPTMCPELVLGGIAAPSEGGPQKCGSVFLPLYPTLSLCLFLSLSLLFSRSNEALFRRFAPLSGARTTDSI